MSYRAARHHVEIDKSESSRTEISKLFVVVGDRFTNYYFTYSLALGRKSRDIVQIVYKMKRNQCKKNNESKA